MNNKSPEPKKFELNLTVLLITGAVIAGGIYVGEISSYLAAVVWVLAVFIDWLNPLKQAAKNLLNAAVIIFALLVAYNVIAQACRPRSLDNFNANPRWEVPAP